MLLDSHYNVYYFKEGVLRTASESYSPENYDDVTSHLTNHVLQKEMSPNFGEYECGNELFFDEFNRSDYFTMLPIQSPYVVLVSLTISPCYQYNPHVWY